jgi:hypothetical protein
MLLQLSFPFTIVYLILLESYLFSQVRESYLMRTGLILKQHKCRNLVIFKKLNP